MKFIYNRAHVTPALAFGASVASGAKQSPATKLEIASSHKPLLTMTDAESTIAAQFESCFREQLRPIRKIGREAEFPLVTADGRAGDVFQLWESLLAEPGFKPIYNNPKTQDLIYAVERGDLNIAVEVGRGTIELSLGPRDDLWQLQKAYDEAIALVARVAEARGMFLLGFGIHPRTPPSSQLMTPRPRYRAMYQAIGAPWLKLTTTAADQTHIDICRAELLDAINWMNLLSAPLIALCANSSVYGGRAGQYLSGREGLLRDLGETRYGMTPHRFNSIEEFIHYLCDYTCFVLRAGDQFTNYQLPFTQLLPHSQTPFEDFLFHEHYVWNSARARVAQSTIEVRPACQQPPDEAFAANALSLGWVESLPEIANYFDNTLRHEAWNLMLAYRRQVVRDGLRAQEPVPHFIFDLVKIAEAGLRRRGRGEEKFLEPVWKRIERRESPGMRAREIFQRKGMDALLEEIKIKSKT